MNKIQAPDIEPMYKAVCQFVKDNQGEKGYIDCQPSIGWDIIYGMMYDDSYGAGTEQFVYAVRYKDNDLEVLLEPVTHTWRLTYSPEDFNSKDAEDKWYSVKWSDVYYVPTIFNIAEFIEEYA